jgi:hypothetical protein
VAATAKHFPGLGSAARNQDTDNGPVTLTVSLAKLRATDEEGEAVTAALAGALGGGHLDPAAFNAAVNRVTALRSGLP